MFVAIYSNNHHHLFHLVHHVGGGVLWANLHLLFWLSLVPFVTAWMGENHFEPIPTAGYGVVALACGLAWLILQGAIIRAQGPGSSVAAAIGKDRKGMASGAMYALAVALAFVDVRLSIALYVAVSLMWLIPDRRFERAARGG